MSQNSECAMLTGSTLDTVSKHLRASKSGSEQAGLSSKIREDGCSGIVVSIC